MAKYETMMVTTANLDEEASNALINKFKNLIAANGTIDSVDDWGKKRLAYPINDETEGVYTAAIRTRTATTAPRLKSWPTTSTLPLPNPQTPHRWVMPVTAHPWQPPLPVPLHRPPLRRAILPAAMTTLH